MMTRTALPAAPACAALGGARLRARPSPVARNPAGPSARRARMPPVAFSSASVARAAPDAASRDPSARLATSRHARRGATLVPTAVAEPPASAAADASASADFDWRDKWYPVAFEADLSDDAPMTFTLLGEPLVFWRDHTANAPDGTPTWRCTADKCPHRLVPLSEGRVNEIRGDRVRLPRVDLRRRLGQVHVHPPASLGRHRAGHRARLAAVVRHPVSDQAGAGHALGVAQVRAGVARV